MLIAEENNQEEILKLIRKLTNEKFVEAVKVWDTTINIAGIKRLLRFQDDIELINKLQELDLNQLEKVHNLIGISKIKNTTKIVLRKSLKINFGS